MSETNTYRFNVTVEIDVTNAETESDAREKAFAVMSTIPVARGRKASGPKAAITGVSIKPQEKEFVTSSTIFPAVMTRNVTE